MCIDLNERSQKIQSSDKLVNIVDIRDSRFDFLVVNYVENDVMVLLMEIDDQNITDNNVIAFDTETTRSTKCTLFVYGNAKSQKST